MVLDLASVGRANGPHTLEWTERDTLLYAVSVGAGQDPLAELALTTENSEGLAQQVLPSFGVVVGQQVLRPDIGDFDRSKLVHAEQHFELHRPLTASGALAVTARVGAIYDKGSGALVWTETTSVDAATGEPVMTARSASFIRGEGGFGGERGPAAAWDAPARQPDVEVAMPVRPEQALLYRLNGDRNPLHSDPAFAARGGFDRPILHGMCTFGFTCRALVAAAGGDPARLTAMGGRFSAPVWPGDTLTVQVWQDNEDVLFRTLRGDGTVVIDHGRARLAEPGGAAGAGTLAAHAGSARR
ncbi:MaoC family dehydratase N-terminal domain-containing protein [Arthrobacter sp. I2-34]|uniref:MaoC family dehydratase N-terminal domain-containing protein n=1 Tax=Arthrobacter hankyongi TaxID=2904801 RepID=A0ABS9LAC6_9MICC|nr:MaoC family dehydratase [Arthrobacter hankyongi]MCG2623414.1 MaoC family dehydratase N-terminal domain-containing protein [Arthrobacter hankyongi]